MKYSINPLSHPAPTAGQKFELTNESTWDAIRRNVEDEFLPVRRAERQIKTQGGRVTNSVDNGLDLFHGRSGDQIRKVREEYVEPITQAMAKAEISKCLSIPFSHVSHPTPRASRHFFSSIPIAESPQ